jgi:hypothetical protein
VSNSATATVKVTMPSVYDPVNLIRGLNIVSLDNRSAGGNG